MNFLFKLVYFNSRPSARGDRVGLSHSHPSLHFNSRPSARGDHSPSVSATRSGISIHAPPRGATKVAVHETIFFKAFQFTPLREGRRSSCCFLRSRQVFQFTPLREGRHGGLARYKIQKMNFNSRPSARGDFFFAILPHRSDYFNSRPSARGDQAAERDAGRSKIFQFTPLREGRQSSFLTCWSLRRIFQFTPLREGRPATIATFSALK